MRTHTLRTLGALLALLSALGLLAGGLAACGGHPTAVLDGAEALRAPLVPEAVAAQGTGEAPLRTLTVTGQGQVNLSPDLAYLTLAVETRNRNLDKAVTQNNQRVAQVIQALRQRGVDEKDIRTTNFAVQQDRHYDDQGNLILGPYTVTNSLVITVRDLEQVGTLLNAALQAGANRVDDLSFGSSQAQAAQLEAKLAAVQDARQQAEAIAQAAGVSIEAVQTITFGYATPVRDLSYKLEAAAAAPAEVPVSPGEMTVTATVTMVFLIR